MGDNKRASHRRQIVFEPVPVHPTHPSDPTLKVAYFAVVDLEDYSVCLIKRQTGVIEYYRCPHDVPEPKSKRMRAILEVLGIAGVSPDKSLKLAAFGHYRL
jgi:hypothetical protein